MTSSDVGPPEAAPPEEEAVRFVSQGQAILGVLHRPAEPVGGQEEPPPTVVFCHGFTGTKVEPHRLFVKAARALARSGIAALRFDFRGSGDSAGEFEEMTLTGEVEDALAALVFARRHAGSPVALLGLSLGGAVATLAAARDPDVAALVLWAAVARPARLARRIAEGPPPPVWRGSWDLGGNLVGRPFIEDLPRHEPLRAAARYQGPVLLVHGGRDEAVPLADSHEYLRAFGGADKSLHVVAEADHTFNRAAWETEVIGTTVRWLTARLGGGAPGA